MIKCPSCGHKNNNNMKFCPECGFKSAVNKGISIQSADFSGASSRAASGAAKSLSAIADELKLVTILFADISGFTAMSGKLSPDEVKEIVDEIFEKLTAAIESEHGKVIKYEGDCIMASFGISESNELDPLYSCYAAIKMQRELSNFSEILKKARGFELKMRVGIHTGRAVVGLIGGRLDIMGDAVNIAARMEQNAGIGKIMITADMEKQLKGRFLLETLEPVKVKGKDEPVRVYNVIDRSAIKSRLIFERSTEMVGRENELKAMIKKFESIENSLVPHLFFIEGPAGCGKSRLIQEFEQQIHKLPRVIRSNKSFFNSTIASDHHVFKVFFKSLDISCGSESELFAHLKKVMSGYDEKTLKDHSKNMAYLLGLDHREDEYLKRMKEKPKEFIPIVFKAFEDYFKAVSNDASYVFFVEDLHWADEGSVKLIDHLLRWVSGKLFFIATSRKGPDEGNFGLPEHKTSVCRLDHLSGGESGLMIKKILCGCGNIEDDLLEKIVRKIGSVASGNPLFIEELIISMHDRGIIFKKDAEWKIDDEKLRVLSLPATVEMAIQARIDSLSREIIDVLKKASVIGRKFSVDVLLYLLDKKPSKKFQSNIDELIEKGILLPAGAGSYLFSHDTIRDVVYDKSTKRQKRELHGRIALRLEDRMSEKSRNENIEALICYHYERAGNIEKTIHYAMLAAKISYDKYRVEDAISHYELVMRFLKDDETLMDENDMIEYIEGYSDAMFLAGRSVGLLDMLNVFDKKICAIAYRVRFNLKKIRAYRIFSDDMENWEKLLIETEEILSGAGNRKILAASGKTEYLALLANLYESWGVFYISFKGICDKTLDYLNKALNIRKKTGDYTNAASCLVNIGLVYSIRGEHKPALDYFEEAMKIAKKTRDKRVTAICLINLGIICQAESDYKTASKYYESALKTAEEIGDQRDIAVSLINIGNIHCHKGEYDKALQCSEKALEIAKEIGHKRGISDWLVEIGEVYIRKGEYDKAADHFKKAMALAEEIGYLFCMGNCMKGLGNICARENDREKALNYYDQALKLYEKSGSIAEADNLKKTIDECIKM